VVDDEQPIRLSARHAEFFFINFAKELALIKLRGALEIAAKIRPGYVEDFHFHPACRVKPGDQPSEPAPASLKTAQPCVMEDRIDLRADQGIERRYVTIDQRSAVFPIGCKPQCDLRSKPLGECFRNRAKREGCNASGRDTVRPEEGARQNQLPKRRRAFPSHLVGSEDDSCLIQPALPGRYSCAGWPHALCGMRATNLMLVVSSSNCSHGLRYAIAL
jgi:hypothetical protein